MSRDTMTHSSVVWFTVAFFLFYLKLTLTTEVIPERCEVYYVNKKYLKDVDAYIRRTSRKSPYYFNIEVTTLPWFGDNVTLHGTFYEFLHNEYKRGFVELDMSLCDVSHKEPWYTLLGKTLLARGFTCPTPPGTYKLHNMTISMSKFPYVWPFERTMFECYAKLIPTQEILVRARFYVTFKHDVPKGKQAMLSSIRIIPERTEVTYANEKYLYNVSAHVVRYGRKSTYYYNLEGGIRHVWGNNITIHLSFFESQNNQYKRIFMEVQLKLCDMFKKDQFFGKMFATVLTKYGISCPFSPGMYRFLNETLPSEKFPNLLPFQKGKLEMKLNQLPTQDLIGSLYTICYVKPT